MTPLKLGLAVLAMGWFGFQRIGSFTMGETRFTLSNAEIKYEGSKEAKGEKHILLTGSPVEIQALEKGLTVRGRTVELTWAELDAKTTEFRKGRVEGEATIIMDSEQAQKALAESASQNNRPAPVPSPETTYLEAHSQLFAYTGTSEQGTITIPNSWTLKQSSKGVVTPKDPKKAKVDFDQVIDASGASGVMNIVRGADGTLSQPGTGSLEGPVHLKVVRHETEQGSSKQSTKTYAIVADHIDIDLLTHPGTIVAKGHVTLDTDEAGFKAHLTDDEFVFRVNEKFDFLGFEGHGKPGTAVGKSKDGSN